MQGSELGQAEPAKGRVQRHPFSMNGEVFYDVVDREGVVIFRAIKHPRVSAARVEGLLTELLIDDQQEQLAVQNLDYKVREFNRRASSGEEETSGPTLSLHRPL